MKSFKAISTIFVIVSWVLGFTLFAKLFNDSIVLVEPFYRKVMIWLCLSGSFIALGLERVSSALWCLVNILPIGGLMLLLLKENKNEEFVRVFLMPLFLVVSLQIIIICFPRSMARRFQSYLPKDPK